MPSPVGARRRAALPFRLHHCTEVEAFMAKGYSLTAFAGEIGTSRANLERWRADYSSFAEAVERGQARRARVLEDRMLSSKGVKALAAQLDALKAAAPEEWCGPSASPAPRRAAGPAVDLPDNGRD